MNKNVLTITAVVLFHLTAVTIMLVQPGCKSDAAKASAPQPAEAANATAATPAPEMSPPTRPAPETLPAPVTVATLTPGAEPLNANTAMNATPPPAPVAPAPTMKNYAVKAGDNLTRIARENGVTIEELVAANSASGLTRTTVLRTGRELVIPAHAASSAAPATAATSPDEGAYKVASGENLTVIARKLGTTIAALKAANNLSNDTVHAGQMLKIPTAATAAATTAAPTATTGASGDEYTVEPGDSPQIIARKTGVKVTELMALNKLTNESARNLKPGQKLKLPPKSGASASPVVTPASPAPAMPAPAPVAATPAPMAVTAVPVATGTESPPVAPVAQ